MIPGGDRDPDHLAWTRVLDRLEYDAHLAEQLLLSTAEPGMGPKPWDPPRTLGPIPEQLVARAQAVHERQVAVQRRLAEAVATQRRHMTLTDRVRGAHAATAPVYLDTTA